MTDTIQESEPLLSESDINRIKAEEILKYKVRKELEGENGKGNGLWKWLNSPFFLLILSAGVLSSAGKIVSATIENSKEKALLIRETKLHLYELDNRITEIDRLVAILNTNPDDTGVSIMLGYIINGDSSVYYKPTQPQFMTISLMTLVSWFGLNSKNLTTLDTAYQAAKAMGGLRDIHYHWDIPKAKEAIVHLNEFRNQASEVVRQ